MESTAAVDGKDENDVFAGFEGFGEDGPILDLGRPDGLCYLGVAGAGTGDDLRLQMHLRTFSSLNDFTMKYLVSI